jgi:tRNA (guanine-N7-)-methyltransferase
MTAPVSKSPAPDNGAAPLRPVVEDLWRRVDSLTGPVRFRDWFGDDGPVEIEIGCGKGRFIVESALARPDTRFVGVEKEGKYLKRARLRVEKAGVTNVRLVHGDMVYFLLNRIPDKTVAVVHIYFPDPWPKRRHKKRRMFSDLSVEQFARVLRPGGRLILKTDVPVNYARARRVMEDSRLFDCEDLAVWPSGEAPEDNIATNFEVKYDAIGKEVFHARWRVRNL